MEASKKPPPRYLAVVVLCCVNLTKLEQCFPDSSPLYRPGLGWGTGEIRARLGRQKWSGSHVYTRKVTVKSGALAAHAPCLGSAGSSCQHDIAAGSAAVPAGSCCFSSFWTRCVSSVTKGASFSPASSELEVWRQLEMNVGSTSSSWVPGHPCFSHTRSVSVRVLPDKQNQ